MKSTALSNNNRIRPAPIELLLDHMSHMVSLYIHVVIDLPKKIDLQILHRAMRLVASKEPVISSRYIRRENRAYWQTEKDPSWDIKETYIGDEFCGYSPDLVSNSSHPENQLPIGIRLMHLKHCDRLHIRISHILSDAGGSRKLVYNLAAAYRKALSQTDRHAPPAAYAFKDTTNMESRDFKSVFKCLTNFRTDLLLSGLWSDKIAFLPNKNYFTIPMKLGKDSARKIVTLHIDSNRVARLKKRGKKHNATLNDILLTAFSRALSNQFESTQTTGKKLGIIVTSDMRKFIGCDDYLGNMSNWGILKLGKIPLSRKAEFIEDVVRSTRRWKKKLCGLGNFLFNLAILQCNTDRSIRFITRKFITAGPVSKACRIVFTNLGKLDREKLDFGNGPCLNGYILPPIGFPPLFIAGASGFAGKLSISMGYLTGSLSDNAIADLTDEIDRELRILE